MRELTLYSRIYCSLCDVMLEALQKRQKALQFVIKVVDVDADPALDEKYGELVPVLMDGDAEIFHYHFNEKRLHSYLQAS
ncbi:MAG: glutaredoxin family protein [Candidatus Polarisedimenticolaceae bacterium]|nr:glutaredoxin family protein [Candidatus Polarisedimenticolaceae bacterium]